MTPVHGEAPKCAPHMMWLRKAEAIALLCGSFVLAFWVVRERDMVTAELTHIGIWAYPVAVLLLALVASAPFSVTDALAVMNGVIFGPVRGSLVNAVGIVCAAIIGYYVARRTSSLLELDTTIERLPRWIRHFRIGSFAFLVTVRILPGIGGTVATQVAAAKRVPLWIHVLAMCTIAVPICTALAIGGDRLANAIDTKVRASIHRYAHDHDVHMPQVVRRPKPYASPRDSNSRLYFDAHIGEAAADVILPSSPHLNRLRVSSGLGGHDLLGQRQLAAGVLDRLLGGGGGGVGGDGQLAGDLAVAEQAHAVLLAADHAGGDQGGRIDGLFGVELAGSDGLGEAPQVHLGELQPVRIVEAALGHPHVQRHLAAFERLEAVTGAGLLALDAAAAGLALAGALAASDAHAQLMGAFVVLKFVQFHSAFSLELCARLRA